VRWDGRWVTPEERDAAVAERDAALKRAREESDEQARVRETEARLRAAEAEARIAEAQARQQEAQARAAEIQAAAFPAPLLPGYDTPYPPAPYYGYAGFGGAPVIVNAAPPAACSRPVLGRGAARRSGIRPIAMPREWQGRMTPTIGGGRRQLRAAGCSR
jgi:hypothetical protein